MNGRVVYEDISERGKISNIEAVLQYLDNILSTKKGSIPFKREFGTELENYLFQPYTFATMKLMEAEIRRSIARNAPMVRIQKMYTEFDPDSQKYNVEIQFTVDKLEDIQVYSTDLKIKGQ